MSKSIEDIKARRRQPLAQLNIEMAQQLRAHDSRLDCFMNYQPPPIYMGPDGFFASKCKTKAVIGGNKSHKTTVNMYKCVMVYTGIIPPAMKGLYAYEDDLLAMKSGPKKRPRFVRIIVQDYSKAWPETIKPMLLGDPDMGARGFLPEAWGNNYDKEEHIFYGPDGSKLSIMSVDPTQKLDPRRLRGPLIDLTFIDEGTIQAAYSESLTRSVGLQDGPKEVSLGFCPQDGMKDWTFKDIYQACYDPITNERLPIEDQNPDIYTVRVSMRDNPDMSEEEIKAIENSIPPYQVAYRIHGFYSEMATNPYFNMDMLQEWLKAGETSNGVPYRITPDEIDLDNGVFEGDVEVVEDRFDEKTEPIWRIWEPPEEGGKYIVTADTAMGNPKSDYQVSDVLKIMDMKGWYMAYQVGQLRIRELKPGDFAIQCAMMANWYGKCMLVPETNTESGGIFVDRIRNYENFYTRITAGQINEQETKRIGWHSDRYSKPMMLESTYKSLQKCYGVGFCPINSAFTLNELMGYEERIVEDKMGDYLKTEWGNRPGGHDDTVIAYGIGTRVAMHEFDKLSACKMPKAVLPSRHLTENEKKAIGLKSGRAFSGMRPQPNLEECRRRSHGR